MRFYGWIAAALVGGVILTGCGGNGAQTADGSAKDGDASVVNGQDSGTEETPVEPGEEVEAIEPTFGPTATPAEVVSVFLDALQAGDTPRVAGILTKKARVEMSREGYEVNADARPGTKFEIGTVEYVGSRKEGAHVESLWTAPDEKEGPSTFSVIWILRKQERGWRVAGMAYDGEETGAKEFVNFENPRETFNKQQENVETATKGSTGRRSATRQK